MNYPLISEYIESIMCAEENFATLTNLRPVLDDESKPMMSSGNFAVVFKMQEAVTEKYARPKYYALKCFIKDQKGRSSNYKEISNTLQKVQSKHIVNFKYLENELYVQCNGDYIDAPVVVMDWVDGVALDKFIEQNTDDSFRLKFLAYNFVDFINWLKRMPFAHGDLKPDNILVEKDCTIIIIDYDGMFVPSMHSMESNEIGSPNYQHPLRNPSHFSKDIDDFSLLIIIIEILYSQIGVGTTLPLFLESDFHNPMNSQNIKRILPSLNTALNIAIVTMVNSLIDNHIKIDNGTFNTIGSIVKKQYYEASRSELARIKEFYSLHKGSLRAFNKRGHRGAEENYPVFPSVYVSGYEYKDDGYPCVIKDGCLLKVSDEYLYGYEGEAYDDSWDLIVIPDDIIAISDEAFRGCSCVQFVVLPNTNKSIGNHVFTECDNLKYIVLPERIETIGNNFIKLWSVVKEDLFQRFDNGFIKQFENQVVSRLKLDRRFLRHIKLSGNLEIYTDLFKYYKECCCNFKNLLVPDGSKKYYQDLIPEYKDYIIDFSEFINSDNVEVNPITACIAKKIGVNSSKIIVYEGDEDEYIIPSHVKIICSHAFANNEKLKKVVIPESVTSFGAYIFKDCKNLESITLPSTMTYIPVGFLYGCKNLKEITLPSSIKEIKSCAFEYCESLQKINIPSGVTTIGIRAFRYCRSLVSISLCNTMKIGDCAFAYCTALSYITLPSKMGKIGFGTFQECKSLNAIDVSYGLSSIPSNCFDGCKSLRSVSLPNSIKVISSGAFSYCENLNAIALPLSLQSIFSGAFSGSGLTSIKIPHNVEVIGYSAFNTCKKLRSVEIPSNTKLKKIEKSVFEGCESIEELTIPECIDNIEEWAFGGCKSLKTIKLPSHIKKIENGLFRECVSLENVNNINNIISIGQEAFFRCRNLRSLTLPQQLSEIGHNSLCGVNINNINILSDYFEKDNFAIYTKGKKSLIEVLMVSPSWVIPEGVEEIKAWAFNGCRFAKMVIPNSVKELCNGAFVSCSIDRIEINTLLTVHPSTFSEGIKEIAVPKHLVELYKKAVRNQNGYSLYDIDKKITSLD